MFEHVGQDTQRQRLDLRNSACTRGAVGHDARQAQNLGQPTTVVFLFGVEMQDENLFQTRRSSKMRRGWQATAQLFGKVAPPGRAVTGNLRVIG